MEDPIEKKFLEASQTYIAFTTAAIILANPNWQPIIWRVKTQKWEELVSENPFS